MENGELDAVGSESVCLWQQRLNAPFLGRNTIFGREKRRNAAALIVGERRPRGLRMRVNVFPSAEAALVAARQRVPRWPKLNALAMYSSSLGGIVTAPEMMVRSRVPLRSS